MQIGMTMFWAEYVATFTWCLNETNFAVAQPTLIGVCLYGITYELETGKIEIAWPKFLVKKVLCPTQFTQYRLAKFF